MSPQTVALSSRFKLGWVKKLPCDLDIKAISSLSRGCRILGLVTELRYAIPVFITEFLERILYYGLCYFKKL